MRNFKAILLSTLMVSSAFVGFSTPAHAEYMPGTSGYTQFFNNTPPQIDNSNLEKNSTMVCYSTFCSYESGLLRIPVFSAEHLTATQVRSAKGASRRGLSFYPDPHIPAEYSSTVHDFTNSGYDRGHMAPWADLADPDCFTLANILPQMADNNRHLWEGIETSVRNLALQYGEVYVVSGPIFTQQVRFLNGRVAIPDHLYKAVYVPALQKASVYITKNADGYEWTQISLDQLYQLTHVHQFPGLSGIGTFNLPEPDVHGKRIPISDSNVVFTNVETGSDSSTSPSPEHKESEMKRYFHTEARHFLKNMIHNW